jgi:menaquinone-dependent protoporphyrinogen oxidase
VPETVLIAYVSRYGTSKRVAERVAAQVQAAGHVPVLRDLRDNDAFDPSATFVVAVGAVYSNQHDDTLVKVLAAWSPQLGDRKQALVSISLAAALPPEVGEAMTLDYVEELGQLTGFKPDRVALVAGALNESAYDGPTQALLNIAHWRTGLDATGDASFTDGAALDRTVRRWLGLRR